MTDWDRIVALHGPPILRLACRILGPGPDAEDAVQEAFLLLYRVSQEEEIGNVAGLLYRTITNKSLDRLRRRKVRAAEPLAFDPASREDDPSDAATAAELAMQLRVAIGRLPEQQAAIFCLRYFEEMSYNEIATLRDVDVSTVATSLHKARAKLASMMTITAHKE